MSSSMMSETDKLNKENVASGRQLQIDCIIQQILQNLMTMVTIIIIIIIVISCNNYYNLQEMTIFNVVNS